MEFRAIVVEVNMKKSDLRPANDNEKIRGKLCMSSLSLKCGPDASCLNLELTVLGGCGVIRQIKPLSSNSAKTTPASYGSSRRGSRVCMYEVVRHDRVY